MYKNYYFHIQYNIMKNNETINKIYSSERYEDSKSQASNPLGSYYKADRVNLMSKETAANFNTYRNWREFDLVFPKIWDDDGKLTTVKQPSGKGVKSLFSPVAGVYSDVPLRDKMNIPLLDNPSTRNNIRTNTDCSIKSLVDASESGMMGRAVYNYSDFMYCTHLGKVPNNYLITLRKFPLPCGDHINNSYKEEVATNKHLPDMGRLVTWLGVSGNEMSNILSYSYTIPWQENKAPLDEEPMGTIGKSGGGNLGQLLSALDGTYGKEVARSGGYGYGDSNFVAGLLGGGYGDSGNIRNLDKNDTRRIVSSRQNAIMKVTVPGGKDDGLNFEQNIKLVFDYQLRSYDGINARTAMLDLIGNILIVTYLQGKFFPGSYRSTNMAQSSIFTNLDIFKNKDACKSPGNFLNSMWTSVQQVASGFTKGGKSTKEALKQLGNNLFEIMANGLINKIGRPQIQAFSSLITPTPTGQWHLTIGNPRNPILSIGNLILKKSTITHYGPLGLDDFPTGLKVEVELEHAKPRDSVAIEQMYMHGNHRIYTPMDEKILTMYSDSKNYNRLDKVTRETFTGSTKEELKKKSAEITNSLTDNSKNIFKKYFGTFDPQSILITAQEAMVGADKTDKKKKK